MKHRALAIVLAICMVISMLPMTVFAAADRKTGQIDVHPQLTTDLQAQPELTALPELPNQPTAGAYTISAKVVKGSGHGEVELSDTSGYSGDKIYLLADPDDGYLAQIGGSYEYRYHEMEVVYLGLDIYEITMPDGNVKLEISFVAASGSNHSVNLSVNDAKGGSITASRTQAKEGESVILEVTANDGYYLENVYALDANGDSVVGGYLGQDENGKELFELIMPATALYVEAVFQVKVPHRITIDLFGGEVNGNAYVDNDYLMAGEEFILTVEPRYTLDVDVIDTRSDEGFVPVYWISEGKWRGTMPNCDLHIMISTKPAYRTLTVNVANPEFGSINIGGDVRQERVGKEVWVRCYPVEGYKATLTGVDGIIDNGDDSFRFEMPRQNVTVTVTFKPRYNPITLTVPAGQHGTASLSHTQAEAGELVTLTCVPEEGYKVAKITGVDELTENGDGTYTFVMPDEAVKLTVTFKKIYEPVTVTVDTGLGGTAYADVTEAKMGDTVTLTCTPEEGYRIAQITGVDGLVDNGDNTYSFTMPDEPVELHVLFLRQNNPFLDVNETHFFHDSVLWAVEKGITNGIDDTHFGPFLTTNRAAVVTMLWRYAGSPAPESTENPFTDVPEGSFYYDAVLWAVEKGITNGLTADTFGPAANCNRAQVVTFLWRFLGQPESSLTEHPFTDVEAGSFYEQAVLWALENGITTGATETTFNPGGECLRAQFVTFLYRTAQLPQPEPEPEPTDPTEPEVPTEPTEPTDPSEPTEPEPTDPTDPIA